MTLWFGPQMPLRWETSGDQAFHWTACFPAGTVQNWTVTAISKWKSRLPASIPKRSTGDLILVSVCALLHLASSLKRELTAK